MNQTSSSIGMAIAIAIGAMGMAPQAHAETKGFSTNSCVPSGAAAANDLAYSHQGLFNASFTENRIVICPLISDAEDAYSATNGGSVFVRYRTASGTPGQINCTIYVGSLSTSTFSASFVGPPQPANTNSSFSIDWTPAESNGFIGEPVNLACALTPRVRMGKIFFTENGATDTP